MQINSALPSVLSVTFPDNFLAFLKSFNFVNVDFISITGATCIDGVDFRTKFATMSLLPIVAVLIGIIEYRYGKFTQKKKVQKSKIKEVAQELFLMVDEDHSGLVEANEYKALLLNFSNGTENIVE